MSGYTPPNAGVSVLMGWIALKTHRIYRYAP